MSTLDADMAGAGSAVLPDPLGDRGLVTAGHEAVGEVPVNGPAGSGGAPPSSG